MLITRAIRFTALNVLILVGLLFLVNVSILLLFEGYRIYKSVHHRLHSVPTVPVSPRTMLPNYQGAEWVGIHFREFAALRSEYRSYVGWRRLPFNGKTVRVDENGIRHTPQYETATEESPLVVFLGGSTMWGKGADDANTIPAFVAEISRGKYRTMNLGESLYNAFQGYLFLKIQIMDGLRPDVVISYDGVNEVGAFLAGNSSMSHAREIQIRNAMRGRDSTRKEEPLSLSRYLLGPIRDAISRVKKKYGGRSGNVSRQLAIYEYDLSEKRAEAAARALLESWLSTKRLADEHGAKFWAILQPNPAVGSPNLDHLRISWTRLEPAKHLYPKLLDLLHTPEYRALARSVLNFTDAFDGDEYIYIDWCHVSPNGNRIIAERILELLDSSL